MGAWVAVAVAFLPEDAQTLAVRDHGRKVTGGRGYNIASFDWHVVCGSVI